MYLHGLMTHGMVVKKVLNRVFAVYHGVDTKQYRPIKNVEREGFTVGFIGRCTPVKGIDIIPQLASMLLKEIPEVRFHIVTKTEAQNPLFLELTSRIHAMGLHDVVEVDNTFYRGEEKTRLINSWNLVLVPSRYEPQGQVDLEAMACGVAPAVGMGQVI